MKRIKVEIAPGVETEFVDRDRALAQVAEWAEESTRWPVVVFGPEGCGKTAFLRQAASGLRELGYDVFYLHPLDRVFAAEVDDADVKSLFLDLVRKTLDETKARCAEDIYFVSSGAEEWRLAKTKEGGREKGRHSSQC